MWLTLWSDPRRCRLASWVGSKSDNQFRRLRLGADSAWYETRKIQTDLENRQITVWAWSTFPPRRDRTILLDAGPLRHSQSNQIKSTILIDRTTSTHGTRTVWDMIWKWGWHAWTKYFYYNNEYKPGLPGRFIFYTRFNLDHKIMQKGPFFQWASCWTFCHQGCRAVFVRTGSQCNSHHCDCTVLRHIAAK